MKNVNRWERALVITESESQREGKKAGKKRKFK